MADGLVAAIRLVHVLTSCGSADLPVGLLVIRPRPAVRYRPSDVRHRPQTGIRSS
ncbi:hypothetical protein ACFPM0_17230 [Pseudonocardia sulfidoxydans]|uniref:hypothetical protein n=1 Tax=Pseudonocardia sulfidoxydans TaxID=54011 RepID=UPI003608B975